MDITIHFATFSGVVGLTTVLSGYFNRAVPDAVVVLKTIQLRQLVSWLVGFGVAFAGHYFGFGFLTGISTIEVLAVGFMASLAANGVFKVELAQALLEMIRAKAK